MSQQLPNWLVAALAENAAPSPGPDRSAEDLYPGDIWVVNEAGTNSLRRHVLVLDADAETGLLHVCLLSNETSLAGDSDIVLPADATGAPYELMVETQLHTKVLWSQAALAVGAIDDDLLDDVLDFIWDDRPERLEQWRGLPSSRKSAARIDFEIQEATDLEALSWCASPSGAPTEDTYLDASVVSALGDESLPHGKMAAVLELWRAVPHGSVRLCAFSMHGFVRPERQGGLIADNVSQYSALLQSLSRDLLSDDAQCKVITSAAGEGPAWILFNSSAHLSADQALNRGASRSVRVVCDEVDESERSRPVGRLEDGRVVFLTGLSPCA